MSDEELSEAVWSVANNLDAMVLSKREVIATLAMHSLMQRLQLDSPLRVADNAVKYADALILELDKEIQVSEAVVPEKGDQSETEST